MSDFEKSEHKSDYWLYKLLDKASLPICPGEWFFNLGILAFVLFGIDYFFIEPESAIQQAVVESRGDKAMMGLLLSAIGVLIMELKRRNKTVNK